MMLLKSSAKKTSTLSGSREPRSAIARRRGLLALSMVLLIGAYNWALAVALWKRHIDLLAEVNGNWGPSCERNRMAVARRHQVPL